MKRAFLSNFDACASADIFISFDKIKKSNENHQTKKSCENHLIQLK